MQLHPREIIERIAALDEAEVLEPTVEPGTAPPVETPTERPARRPSRSPWTMPPDMEPGQEPRPKAEDESEQIAGWLEMTQQPVRDWDWDGNELRLALDDGSTEVYTRGQLQEIGIFGDQMAFAESEDGPEEDFSADPGNNLYDFEGPDLETVQSAIDAEQPGNNEAAGTLDQILGRVPSSAGPGGAQGEGDVQVVEIDGGQAEEVIDAVSDLVKAIIGVAGSSEEGGDEPKDSGEDKEGGKKKKDSKDDGDKSKKEKKSKDKKADKDEDKDEDKKDDE